MCDRALKLFRMMIYERVHRVCTDWSNYRHTHSPFLKIFNSPTSLPFFCSGCNETQAYANHHPSRNPGRRTYHSRCRLHYTVVVKVSKSRPKKCNNETGCSHSANRDPYQSVVMTAKRRNTLLRTHGRGELEELDEDGAGSHPLHMKQARTG